MKEAIKRAIEGGYHGGILEAHEITKMALLDPLFWQALGKTFEPTKGATVANCVSKYQGKGEFLWVFDWNIQWHRFIDHLAEGKDVDSFFTHLIT